MEASKKYCKGQTLAEIVIVIGIVLLLVTGLVVGATASLKAAQFGRSKSLAINYAQDAVEVTRSLRDKSTDWTTLLNYSNTNNGVWCLDANENWSQANGSSCPVNINNIYSRKVTFSWNDPTMQVTALVSWGNGSRNYNTSISTYFTDWQTLLPTPTPTP